MGGVAAIIVTLALALSGCGGGGGDGARTTSSAETGSGQAPVEWGARTLQQTSRTADAGAHPTFAWHPVTGATRYRVVVLRDGATWWTWEGADTSVMLGGGDAKIADRAIGPGLPDSAQWSVAALAADGAVVALSGQRQVSR